MTRTIAIRLLLASAALPLAGVALAPPAAAQTSTARVNGRVADAAGAPVAGAAVVAVNEGTNQTVRAVTDANGAYNLNGVRPGPYRVTATAQAGGATVTRRVVVAVGQAATLDLRLGAAPAATNAGQEVTATAPEAEGTDGDIVVTGTRLRETRTSEVATNISQAQIRILPQTDRNFLSFAALAPGVQYVDSETNRGIQSGASTRAGVNVFIDGVSLKNQVLEGGVAGQQDSRGNPFGQLAVGEFRVLTQNFKAEYEQAGAAIVTAITKSGTNEFHGEVFGQYTDRSLTTKSVFDKRDGNPEPRFKRVQYGASLGGPIVRDRLFFFGAYEGNDQDRAFTVRVGNRTPANLARFGQYEGQFVSPFRQDFYFGKLTFTPDEAQVFDISYSKRKETDIQGFGGAGRIAFESAENKINNVDTYQGKWTYNGGSFVNELNLSFARSDFNPTALNPNLPAQVFDGVITIGGKDSTRQYVQEVWTGRNDFTYSGIDRHVIKAGVRLAVVDFTVVRTDAPAGRYFYQISNNNTPNITTDDTDFSFPREVRYGLGNPRVTASDTQVGLYLQDDWDLTETLQLNLGLRWDYETNPFNNDFVTGNRAAAALRALPATSYFNPEDYISTGNRKPFWKAFQPRAGFSWDIKNDQSTVIFGGAGRYYDRNVFNQSLEETFRRQYSAGVFYFSRDGRPRNPQVDAAGNPVPGTGLPTVVWNDSYLDPANLQALRAQAVTGLPELFANLNNARLPRTDQFSAGVRQALGPWQASLTASYIRGKNGYTYLFATRNNNGLGGCCNTAPLQPFGYSNALIGYDGLDTRYKALYFTLDKNYTEASGWGLNINYTFAKGKQNGGDLFSLDGITPDAYGYRPRAGDERHRVVVSGILDLPLGFQFSTLSTFGSGQAYQVFDSTDPTQGRLLGLYPVKTCIKGVFAFCEVNLTLQNRLRIFGDHEISVAVDLFNAFNNKNYTGFDGALNNQIRNGQVVDPLDRADFSSATGLLTLPRRFQFRVGYKF